jgi:IS5 family transposase
MEDALHDIPLYQEIARLDAAMTRLPDQTTFLRYRHMLEAHGLGKQILATVNAKLIDRGLMLKTGIVVDATLIAAPCSTKNDKGERDPEMHQTKKGNHLHFGRKAHIGVDAESDMVYTATIIAANAHDITQAYALLQGEEEMVFVDSVYRGVEKREEIQKQHPDVDWQIAMTPGKRRVLNKNKPSHALRDKLQKLKASMRAKVEHPFRVFKCQFGHRKTRYWGLAKNTNQLLVMFELSNLWMVRNRILQGAQA